MYESTMWCLSFAFKMLDLASPTPTDMFIALLLRYSLRPLYSHLVGTCRRRYALIALPYKMGHYNNQMGIIYIKYYLWLHGSAQFCFALQATNWIWIGSDGTIIGQGFDLRNRVAAYRPICFSLRWMNLIKHNTVGLTHFLRCFSSRNSRWWKSTRCCLLLRQHTQTTEN